MKKEKKIEGAKYIFIALGIIIIISLIAAFPLIKTKFFTTKEIPKSDLYGANITNVITQNGEIVSYKFNNFLFEKQDNIWYTQVQQGSQVYTISFTYGPINLENISIIFNPNDFQKLTTSGSKVYVTFDHDSANASYIATSAINIINNLKTVYGVKVQRACLTNTTTCVDAPVITCDNTDKAVIQFIDSETNSIEYKDNCLTIKSSGKDYIKSGEKIILNWYKIV